MTGAQRVARFLKEVFYYESRFDGKTTVLKIDYTILNPPTSAARGQDRSVPYRRNERAESPQLGRAYVQHSERELRPGHNEGKSRQSYAPGSVAFHVLIGISFAA
jgi:hypothetical protein